jgi:cysteinyl-tRNA synthetase
VNALNDNFNTPVAISGLFDLAKLTNTLLNAPEVPNRASLQAIDQLYRELGGQVLGIVPEQAAAASADAEREAGLIRLLIDMRAEARQRKDFATSDQIRERLRALGVTLEDGKGGTTWKIG